MLTKKEFAEMIIDEFCESEKIQRADAHNHIYASSRLAVALEFMGELSTFEQEYSRTRGGTEYRTPVFNEDGTFKDLHILSTRDMLEMLPYTLNSRNTDMSINNLLKSVK